MNARTVPFAHLFKQQFSTLISWSLNLLDSCPSRSRIINSRFHFCIHVCTLSTITEHGRVYMMDNAWSISGNSENEIIKVL